MIHDEFPDWYEVLRVSVATGFEFDSDQSDDETDAETNSWQSAGHRRPFRPWQGGGRSHEKEPEHGTTRDATDGSGSEMSGKEQSHGQGARRKVFTKNNRSSGCLRKRKLTEIVAKNLKHQREKGDRIKFTFRRNRIYIRALEILLNV